MTSQEPKELTYFEARMNELGAKPTDYAGLFEPAESGDILISFLSLGGDYVKIERGKDAKTKRYQLARLHPSRVQGDNKYIRPRGSETRGIISSFPWFSPGLIDKYRRGIEINTLIITEGIFKAFKGSLHGLDIIGIQGIQQFRVGEKYKNALGEELERKVLDYEIAEIVKVCKVRNVIFLMDGDCLSINFNLDDPHKDYFLRPNSFFSAVKNFRECFKGFPQVDVYFAHIQPDQPKGLDDLLCANTGREAMVLECLTDLIATEFFYVWNITNENSNQIENYFKINDANVFYRQHRDVIGSNAFIFKRTQYRFHEGDDALEVLRAKEADMFMRVGDDYIKRKLRPSRDGRLIPVYEKILKSTIKDDYGHKIKNIFSMIPKYEGFINMPDFLNYQAVINGWYNQSKPFLHTPAPGDCPVSLEMVKHIFGYQLIEFMGKEVPMWEFGLDYIQLLYQKPREFLPILCLVSQENQSGKGTFKNWIRYILGENSTDITINEIDGDFNEGYADKVLVCLDEAFSDKKSVKETLKYISTNLNIKVNAKGISRYEIECFIKFMVLSNNEKDFLPINKDDDRFWVLKVPKPKYNNVAIYEDLVDEVPAFLDFLNRRRLIVEQKQARMWFPPQVLKTEALAKVISFSRTWLEKAIDDIVREIFFNLLVCEDVYEHNPNIKIYELDEICLDRAYIIDTLKKNNYNNFTTHQVSDCLQHNFGITVNPNTYFAYPEISQYIGSDGEPVKAIKFPKKYNNHYKFKRSEFISQTELEEYAQLRAKNHRAPLSPATGAEGYPQEWDKVASVF